MLIEWNNKFNLTAITDKEEVIEKHFIDSVLPYTLIPQGTTVCDIGSGAGFPALPLKIVRDDLKFVLVDSLNKRVAFLHEVVNALKLTDVTCLHSRAEDIAFNSKYREKFDVCVARAVAKLNTLSEICLPFVKVGGVFIAYKSAQIEEELNESKVAIAVLGAKVREIKLIDIPDTEVKRAFVIIEKNKNTPIKYPRGQNKPKIDPII